MSESHPRHDFIARLTYTGGRTVDALLKWQPEHEYLVIDTTDGDKKWWVVGPDFEFGRTHYAAFNGTYATTEKNACDDVSFVLRSASARWDERGFGPSPD
jgi:hypothetical protein